MLLVIRSGQIVKFPVYNLLKLAHGQVHRQFGARLYKNLHIKIYCSMYTIKGLQFLKDRRALRHTTDIDILFGIKKTVLRFYVA